MPMPPDPTIFVPSTTGASEVARSGRSSGPWGVGHRTDPDAQIAAAMKCADGIIRSRLRELLPVLVNNPESRRQIISTVSAAFDEAAEQIGLKARRLRGDRLVHHVALQELEGILLDIQNDPVFARHPVEARAARVLVTDYLHREQGRDEFRSRRIAATGGDPTNPPAYKAPPMPPKLATNTEETP